MPPAALAVLLAATLLTSPSPALAAPATGPGLDGDEQPVDERRDRVGGRPVETGRSVGGEYASPLTGLLPALPSLSGGGRGARAGSGFDDDDGFDDSGVGGLLAASAPALAAPASGSGAAPVEEVSAGEVSAGAASAGEVSAGAASAGEGPVGEESAGEAYPPPLTALLPALPLPLPLLSGGDRGAGGAGSCPDGGAACVDAVIDEMRARFSRLLSTCDHHAAFALTYLRVTESYRRAVADPGFFADTPFVNRHAVVFAEVYFHAADAWRRGDLDAVPPAWETAFRASGDQRVSAVGDLLLGLSAHVNRDLPFVLAGLGLRDPGGGSRKPDHDRVNAVLRAVTGPILTEIAERLDRAASTASIDGTELDETTLFQLLALWREEAWRNAELLTAAPTPTARALVAQTIETTAALKQQALLTATAYRPPLTSAAARATWCRTHR